MDKSTKLYKKSVQVFEKGFIDKALKISKKSVQLNKRNKASLNFIGLLYYFKGDLNNAQKMWSINYKYNGDSISKKYLEDSRKDKENIAIYIRGVKLYEQVKINQALELFKTCERSHFNFINLNNYMSSCYIKKGDYKKAEVHINKVFTMDRKNEIALKNMKLLKEYGQMNIKFNRNTKFIPISMSVIIIALIISFAILKSNSLKNIMSKDKNTKKISMNKESKKEENKNNSISKDIKDKKNNSVKNIKNNEGKNIKKEEQNKISTENNFNIELVNKFINNKEFDNLYKYIVSSNRDRLTINQKLSYDKAVDLLKNEGVKYFYNTALDANKNGNLVEAEKRLIYAKTFSSGNYLNEHILYFLGVIYENKEDIQNALNYYNQYNNSYSKGSYSEVVLYKLAILNTYNDKNLSKKFAKELIKKYPNSIYNNSKIKEIIKN